MASCRPVQDSRSTMCWSPGSTSQEPLRPGRLAGFCQMGCGVNASLDIPPILSDSGLVCRLLLWKISQENGAPWAFLKWLSGNSGRPCVGWAGSQSSACRGVSKRRTLVGLRQRLVAIKMWLLKYGRQWRCLSFPSFTDPAFADRCHLENQAKKVGPAVVLRNISLGALGLVS